MPVIAGPLANRGDDRNACDAANRHWNWPCVASLSHGTTPRVSTHLPTSNDRLDANAAPRAAGKTLSWRLAIGLVVGTSLVANATLVVGKHTGAFDGAEFFCPYFMLTADYARSGQLLHWTPLVNAGVPAGADPQVGAFSPLVTGLGWITGGREFGFRLYWLLTWCAAGLGMLLLARRLAAPAWAGCLAAFGYTFSGIFIGHAQHTPYLVSMAAFPWIIARWDAALGDRSLAAAAQAGAIWGLAALAGYPALTIVGAGYVALWTVGRLLCGRCQAGATTASHTARDIWPQMKWSAFALALFGLVGVVVLAPPYVAFVTETHGYTDRNGPLPREVAAHEGALHPAALSSFASPYVAVLRRYDETLFPGCDASMCTIYLCPLLLVFAVASLLRRPSDGFRWYLAALAVLFLLTALGDVLPFRGWLYDLLPPLRYFRQAALFRCYTIFTLVVLALLAAGQWERVRRRQACPEEGPDRGSVDCEVRRAAWLYAAGALGAALALAWAIRASATDAPAGRLVLPIVHWAVVWAGGALLLWWAGRAQPAASMLAGLRPLFLLALADAVFSAAISKPVMFTDRGKIWNAVEAAHVATVDLPAERLARQRGAATSGQGVALNANLPVKSPALVGYTPMNNMQYDRLMAHPIMAAAAVGPERMWFARNVVVVPPGQAAEHQVLARVDELQQPILVISRPESAEPVEPHARAAQDYPHKVAALPPAEPAKVDLVTYAPLKFEFDVRCPADGWLLVTDRWAPRWTAQVNGQSQEVWQGDFVFRCVRVTAGDNRVSFAYRPLAHPWLVMASWTMLGLVAIGSWWPRRTHSRGKEAESWTR